MATSARQFGLLLWKNWLLAKRKPVIMVCEIVIPMILTIILLILRQYTSAVETTVPTQYPVFLVEKIPESIIPLGLAYPDLLIPTDFKNIWLIAYAPNVSIVNQVMKKVALILNHDNMFNSNKTLPFFHPNGFETEIELEKATQDAVNGQIFFAAVVFVNAFPDELQLPERIRYKVRPRAEQHNRSASASDGNEDDGDGMGRHFNWFTKLMYPSRVNSRLPKVTEFGGIPPGYYQEGFLQLQHAVNMAIIMMLNRSIAMYDQLPKARLQMFPKPPHRSDPFIHFVSDYLPIILLVSFIVATATICKDLVVEKEKKLKESMKLMGMKGYLHWFAWWFKFTLSLSVSIFFITIFLHLRTSNGAIIYYTDPTVTFVFLFLFVESIIALSFMVSSFFAHSNAAAAVGAVFYLILYVPVYFVMPRYDTLTWVEKMSASLDIVVAMSFGCIKLAEFEQAGTGLQWSNLRTTLNEDDSLAMVDVFTMLVVNFFVYALLSWYFDALLPGNFGMPQPLYFPFTKWYWFGHSDRSARLHMEDIDVISYGNRDQFFEKLPHSTRVGIKIRELTKVFPRQPRPSVDDLSLDMYEGEITALLGHNGAGKTTTMFILTGFLPPTSGTAWINGLNIGRDMVKIRQSLGLCPQHDILFDQLTVAEHLVFFAQLKGCPHGMIKSEVNRMIHVLHLEDKRNVASQKLSGGMKRKLSVGIALIADSKFVILDEPTSGMDPESRRQTWDILQGERAGRTIILSTHFMDEADLLGDRIAIMANGQLQCCGTSMFLKKKYGIGYHLTIVRNQYSKSRNISKIIRKFVPDMQREPHTGAELNYILPREQSDRFEELFDVLEKNREKLGIDSFGASITTMEEVFIKVGETLDSVYRIVPEPAVTTTTTTGEVQPRMTPLNPRSPAMSNSTAGFPVSSRFSLARMDSQDQLVRNIVGSQDTLAGPASLTSISDFPGNTAQHRKGPLDTAPSSDDTLVISPTAGTSSAGLDSGVNDRPDQPVRTGGALPHSGRVVRLVEKVRKFSTGIDHQRMSIAESPPPEDENVSVGSGSDEDREDAAGDIAVDTQLVRLTGVMCYLQQTRAMFIKHAIHTYRNFVLTIFQIFAPVFFVTLACAVILTLPKGSDSAPLVLSLAPFHNTTAVPYLLVPNATEADFLADCYARAVEEQRRPIYRVGDSNSINEYLLDLAERSLDDFQHRFVIAASTNVTPTSTPVVQIPGITIGPLPIPVQKERSPTIVGHFKAEAYHSIAVSLAIIDRALMLCHVPERYTLETINHPLPRQEQTIISDKLLGSMLYGFVFSYCLTFGMAFLLSTFIVLPIKERLSGAKHCQFISGVKPSNYWLTTFVWDLAVYMIPVFCIIGIIEAFQIDAFTHDSNIWYVFLSLVGYGVALLPLVFIQSFLYSEATSGYVWATITNILTATASIVVVYILKTPRLHMHRIATTISWILYFGLPNFCFADTIQNIYLNYQVLSICKMVQPHCAQLQESNPCCPGNCGSSGCAEMNENYLGVVLPGIGALLIILFSQSFVYFLLLFLLESDYASRMRRQMARARVGTTLVTPLDMHRSSMLLIPDVDSDVRSERDEMKSTPLDELLKNNAIVVNGLSRSFSGWRAVNQLTFRVPPGECFGLLGINGAGKTTTFKMLTGDLAATFGDAYLLGHSITWDLKEAQKTFGYCPQFDALIDQLTVHETMFMYARLRGIAESSIRDTIDDIIALANLHKHSDKQAGHLSGGNKRKLSTAIALIGDPAIVFLDEPTTGMDPLARRQLWNTLTKVRKRGKTLILTTHSMEECEALCTRLAIMVNGQFKCLGSTQHLKAKFGEGYMLIAKVMSPLSNDAHTIDERTQSLLQFILRSFEGSILKDRHESLLYFHVPSMNFTWARVFGTMERARWQYFIEDYSVCQTSLEQVFISFARAQHAERKRDKTLADWCAAHCHRRLCIDSSCCGRK